MSSVAILALFGVTACTVADYQENIGDVAMTADEFIDSINQFDEKITALRDDQWWRDITTEKAELCVPDDECLAEGSGCNLGVLHLKGEGNRNCKPFLPTSIIDPGIKKDLSGLRIYVKNLQAVVDADTVTKVTNSANAVLECLQPFVDASKDSAEPAEQCVQAVIDADTTDDKVTDIAKSAQECLRSLVVASEDSANAILECLRPFVEASFVDASKDSVKAIQVLLPLFGASDGGASAAQGLLPFGGASSDVGASAAQGLLPFIGASSDGGTSAAQVLLPLVGVTTGSASAVPGGWIVEAIKPFVDLVTWITEQYVRCAKVQALKQATATAQPFIDEMRNFDGKIIDGMEPEDVARSWEEFETMRNIYDESVSKSWKVDEYVEAAEKFDAILSAKKSLTIQLHNLFNAYERLDSELNDACVVVSQDIAPHAR